MFECRCTLSKTKKGLGNTLATQKPDAIKHILIPKHTKLGEKEKKELFETYSITIKDLPRIMSDDPAIAHLDAKHGDIIKIVRDSPTAGKTVFYRGVYNA